MIYIIIGFIYGLYRWNSDVNNIAKKFHEKYGNNIDYGTMICLHAHISICENEENQVYIIGLIIFWPYYIIESLTVKLFNITHDFLFKKFKKTSNDALSKFTLNTQNSIYNKFK